LPGGGVTAGKGGMGTGEGRGGGLVTELKGGKKTNHGPFRSWHEATPTEVKGYRANIKKT